MPRLSKPFEMGVGGIVWGRMIFNTAPQFFLDLLNYSFKIAVAYGGGYRQRGEARVGKTTKTLPAPRVS
tara:strand:+ start:380 stop:586 length:207 start_codon:yes stop_codon:yes gene_type:complete